MRRSGLARLAAVVALLLALILALAAAAGAAEAADRPVFVERFDGPPAAGGWTIFTDADPPGIRRHKADEAPGFHFINVGRGFAYAPWPVGIRPFEMTWEVRIEQGTRQDWRYPGVWVALASAPPGKMTEKDIAVVIAVHQAGVTASVRRPQQGEVYEPNTNPTGYPKPYSRMGDKDLTPRGVLNAGGAGGHFYSIQWPNTDLAGTALAMRVRRTAAGVLEMSVCRPDYKDGLEPWWSGQWQMTPDAAAMPLGYVVVKLVHNPVPPEKLKTLPPAGDVMGGTVSNIQAHLLDVPAPEVSAAVPMDAVLKAGATVCVRGRNFDEGAAVWVGGRPAAVEFASPNGLIVLLPDLAADRRHELVVINPSGLSARAAGGVPYGRLIERVQPREALPAGGDVVTVLGGGFEKGTAILFGGKPGEIVELVDPTQVKVRVPPGTQGRAAVTARTGEAAFAGTPDFGYAGHPYLFFRADTLADLRKKFNEPVFADYRKVLLAIAQDVPEGGAATEKSGKAGIQPLLWAYLLTGEADYKRRLMPVLEAEWDEVNHSEFRLMAAADVATAYDALFAELSARERTKTERYLERAMTVYLAEIRRGNWWYGCGANPSNTVPVGAAGGGLAALALLHSTPLAEEVSRRAPEMVNKWYKAISPDGGCVEGSLYWNYGLSHQLMLGHALLGATGEAHGLLDAPALRKNVRFVETQLGGDDKFFTFNDTQPWLTGVSICADFGSRFDQPLMLWMADHMVRQMAAEGAAKEVRGPLWQAFLWRSRRPAPAEFPGAPTLAVLDVMNWGVMRSDGSHAPNLVVGVKGHAGILTHHGQADLGSFVLQARGEPFLIDPGYYQPAAAAHTLPLVDGQGPGDGKGNSGGAPITGAWESGPWRAMTVDATSAYQKESPARRVRRHLVMCGDRAVVVLDDVLPAEGRPGNVTTHFQCGFKAEVLPDKRSAAVLGEKARLILRTFGPEIALKVTGPNEWGKSWIFKKTGVQWYTIEGEYAAQADSPLLAVLTPADTAGEPPKVEVRREAKAIAVDLGAGRIVRFEQGREGWAFVRP